MLRGLDPDGIRFIGIGNPVLRLGLRTAEVHVALDQAFSTHGVIDINPPNPIDLLILNRNYKDSKNVRCKYRFMPT